MSLLKPHLTETPSQMGMGEEEVSTCWTLQTVLQVCLQESRYHRLSQCFKGKQDVWNGEPGQSCSREAEAQVFMLSQVRKEPWRTLMLFLSLVPLKRKRQPASHAQMCLSTKFAS
jgi:hypothetical protein